MDVINDKGRIARAFTTLRSAGYLASGRAGFTKQEGYQRLVDLQPAVKKYVFYTDQGEADAFDGNGNLRKALHLYWSGETSTLMRAFRDQGLTCDDLDPATAVALHPNPDAIQNTFESVCEAAGRRYGRSTGRPVSSEMVYENLSQEGEAFRLWLSEQPSELFELTELDREACILDDVYERYVGFGLPEHRGP